jgi:hypothetical protein
MSDVCAAALDATQGGRMCDEGWPWLAFSARLYFESQLGCGGIATKYASSSPQCGMRGWGADKGNIIHHSDNFFNHAM